MCSLPQDSGEARVAWVYLASALTMVPRHGFQKVLGEKWRHSQAGPGFQGTTVPEASKVTALLTSRREVKLCAAIQTHLC
jgi:hypothetical protein